MIANPSFMYMTSISNHQNFLKNRWHRTKINRQFSSWQELIQGVPQRSSFGSLLNIYRNDLFYLAQSTNV